jgi:hypothetical protein
VSRISDDELRRLTAALAAPDARPSAGRRDAAESQRIVVERMRSELAQRAGDEALGRDLTQSLAAYLNRPVRAVAGGAAGTIPGAWRYTADLGAIQWWIEFDAPLAASLADAMLGGSGAAAKSGAGRRARALVGKVADVFFHTLSSVVDAAAPGPAVWTATAARPSAAQIAGRCVVNAEPFAWQAGLSSVVEPEQVSTPAASPPASDIVASATHEPALITDVRTAIVAACADLAALPGGAVVVAHATVTELDAPEIPESAIRLAVTTGGTGALIFCAQRDAVLAFASGAVDTKIPESDEIGSVVCAAAEAVLREIIQGIASRLTAIAGVPQRTVPIAADAQLARTRHLAAAVTLHVAGSVANLYVLVPGWMTGPA